MEKYIRTTVFNKVYCTLLEVARREETTNYIDIAHTMGLQSGKPMGNQWQNKTAHILGEICEYEHKHNRPMLSAVVVSKETNIPSKGFFNLARRLGKLTSSDSTDEQIFLTKEIEYVRTTWK